MAEISLPLRVVLSEAPRIELIVVEEHEGAISFCTFGLRAVSKHELAWTVAGRDLNIAQAVQILAFAADQAKAGNAVEAGGFTELAGRGLFGNPRRTGIAYGPGHDVAGLVAELGLSSSDFLRMCSLFDDEMAAAHAFGVARVLNMLGAQARFFPFPSCDVLDRAPVLEQADLAKSPLADASRLGGFHGAASFLSGGRAHLVFDADRVAALAAGLRELGGAVVDTPTDPSLCREALAWQPGADPIIISAASSDDTSVAIDERRVAGSWVMLGPGNPQGARVVEDGFLVLVAPESWDPLLTRLAQGAPLEISPREEGLLALRALPRARPEPAPAGLTLMRVVLVSPEERFDRNVATEQLSDLVTALVARVAEHAGHGEGQLQLDVLLSPSRGPAVSVRGELRGLDVADLERALNVLEEPRSVAETLALEVHLALTARQ